MNKVEELYNNWYKAVCFKSYGLHQDPTWDILVEYVKEHQDEGKDFLIKILREDVSHAVSLAEYIDERCKKFFDGIKEGEYIPLQIMCSIVLNILEGKTKKDDILEYRYKEADEYHEYMKDHYIPWNPFHEDDPNVTIEEFKQGKRNDMELLKRNKEKYESTKTQE